MNTAEIRDALDTAMRQWASYYSEHNSNDIEDAPHAEGAAYRRCQRVLKALLEQELTEPTKETV